MRRILVSGFEAFGGGSSNPSAMICESLNGLGASVSGTDEPIIETVILPVTFAECFEQLRVKIESFKPNAVLALGQAGGRDSIDFERIAVNLIDSEVADNRGVKMRERSITDGGPAAHFSRLPLRELVAAVQDLGIASSISNTAGLYVCNFLFYKLMEFTKEDGRAGFVHLPYTPEQARDAERRRQTQTISSGGRPTRQGAVPSMEFDQMLKAVQAAIRVLNKTKS